MFDDSVPEPGQLAGLTAAGLIDAAAATSRAENTACARKLAVMAEYFIRRTDLAPEDRLTWWLDPDAAVTAELAAAHHITQGLALHQTYRGVVLRDRLPKIGELFLQGLLSDLLVRAIIARTELIVDDDLVAAVDADLAADILTWGPLSIKKTHTEIDAVVTRHDPDAVRTPRPGNDRTVEFGQPGDAPGFSTIYARMFASDSAAGERTVLAMAYSVCEADPRTLDERRNDAFTALMHGITTLSCHCGTADCEAATNPRPLRDISLYAITDQTTQGNEKADGDSTADTVESQPEPEHQAVIETPVPETDVEPERETVVDTTETELRHAAERSGPPNPPRKTKCSRKTTNTRAARKARRTPSRVAQCRRGYIFGAGIMPAPLFEAMLGEDAKVREIIHPGNAGPEVGRFPSRALAAFIRCRDLTCRFPHCDHPATAADIDHTVPHPVGPTHASNLKCLCRFHHLLKTFWGGVTGWRDRQLPDGTVIWTSPTGHTYTTYPGSRRLFPVLCLPTATLWDGDPPEVPVKERRGERMPRRRNTRAHNRAAYIAAQRRRNREERLMRRVLENGETLPPRYELTYGDRSDYGDDPPPF